VTISLLYTILKGHFNIVKYIVLCNLPLYVINMDIASLFANSLFLFLVILNLHCINLHCLQNLHYSVLKYIFNLIRDALKCLFKLKSKYKCGGPSEKTTKWGIFFLPFSFSFCGWVIWNTCMFGDGAHSHINLDPKSTNELYVLWKWRKKGEKVYMCCGDVDNFPPNKLVWRKVWGWYGL
jgi:hypothetical protein